ncbi:MAG: HlyD family secretion protein [Dinoroseobacter sp.]|nr:HlyD family secretion protein [Dinoroseobacter sp.]
MKNLFRATVALALIILVWYLVADRYTPFTSNARVKAVVTPIVPKVSGTIIELPISNSSFVQSGALLARIDPRQFEINLSRAEANLESATQSVGASSAEVERAQAQLVRATSDLENVRLQTARVLVLEEKGLTTRAQADDARNALSDAEANVDVAEADLERARQSLGSEGEDNPRVRAALADLAQAQLDLTYTELLAPALGGVAGLTISEGASAQAGQTLMSFVDARNVWVEAYLTENNFGHLDIGDPVKLVLDTHPGRVLDGQIESMTGAASLGNPPRDGLPRAPTITGWLRDPQRFPVRIILPGYEAGDQEDDVMFLMNGQADVIVLAGDKPVLNAIGNVYIRVLSWLSYAY